jgi:hypothetical protein
MDLGIQSVFVKGSVENDTDLKVTGRAGIVDKSLVGI